MSAVALVRLESEVQRDLESLRLLESQVLALRPAIEVEAPDRRDLSTVALDVHRWYTALESLIERVERVLGALPISSERRHRELLEGATLELQGARPALLPRELLPDLLDLLGFRHFLRHAYVVELDPERLRVVVVRFERTAPRVVESLVRFAGWLRTLVDASVSG